MAAGCFFKILLCNFYPGFFHSLEEQLSKYILSANFLVNRMQKTAWR